MARNTETLSTRDLASPTEPAGGDTISEGDVRDAAAEQTRPRAGEPDAPRPQARTGVSAGGQPVGASRPDAGLGRDSDAPGHEDRPVKSTVAVSPLDQDAQAVPRPTGEADDASNAGGSLLAADMAGPLLQRWKEIQTRFVDEPRGAVQDADSLVANLMAQLAEGFAKERERLEAQWGRGEDISTEDLRVALQHYRTFFQRLLST